MYSIVLLYCFAGYILLVFLFFIDNDINWNSETSLKFILISEVLAMLNLLLCYNTVFA